VRAAASHPCHAHQIGSACSPVKILLRGTCLVSNRAGRRRRAARAQATFLPAATGDSRNLYAGAGSVDGSDRSIDLVFPR
jgi:hypothetical protein